MQRGSPKGPAWPNSSCTSVNPIPQQLPTTDDHDQRGDRKADGHWMRRKPESTAGAGRACPTVTQRNIRLRFVKGECHLRVRAEQTRCSACIGSSFVDDVQRVAGFGQRRHTGQLVVVVRIPGDALRVPCYYAVRWSDGVRVAIGLAVGGEREVGRGSV